MVAALVLRVLGQHHLLPGNMVNLSPMMALAFVGTMVFPKPLPWWSWMLVLLGVDLLSEGLSWWSQANGHAEVLLAYGCYALAAFWGARLRGRAGVLDTLLGTLGCSVLFYLVTNTLSWWIQPEYAKNAAGWWQAMTLGMPGVRPTTLEFFRNSLTADLIGATVLLAIYNGEAVMRRLRTMPLVGWGKVVVAG
jgi:hypothetical protein